MKPCASGRAALVVAVPRVETLGSAQGLALSFIHNLSVGSPPHPIFLTQNSLTRGPTSLPLEAPLNGANGTQVGSLCYIGLPDCRAASQSHPESYRRAPGVTTRRR
jgi:hypothetical protein